MSYSGKEFYVLGRLSKVKGFVKVVDGNLRDVGREIEDIAEDDYHLYVMLRLGSDGDVVRNWKFEDWLNEVIQKENKGMALIVGNQFNSVFSLVCISCGDSYGELPIGELRKKLAEGQELVYCPACESNTCDVCLTVYPSGQQLRSVAGTNFVDKACALCLDDFGLDWDGMIEIAKRQKYPSKA